MNASMTNSWRLLICAAALNVTLNAGVAMAQTVIVRKAPPGSTIELVLNTATVASAPADQAGDATLDVDLSKNISKTETDAYMYVDVCDRLRRVVIVERGVTPPPSGACERKAIAGLFWLRGVTTMVVDVSAAAPTMHLRQGRVPAEWLRDVDPSAPRERRLAPKGLVLSGGVGPASVSGAVATSCGSADQCTGDDSGFAYAASAAFWVTRFLAAEVSYVKPADVTASGSGSTYRFDSRLDADVLSIVGKAGAPIGPVRVYGQLGPAYHRATLSTTQTIDDVTVTSGDVTTTIKGGTQTFELRTQGWGWVFGGGLEGWVTDSVAIFGEFGRGALKGSARDGGEGTIDDRLTFLLAGVRVRLGR